MLPFAEDNREFATPDEIPDKHVADELLKAPCGGDDKIWDEDIDIELKLGDDENFATGQLGDELYVRDDDALWYDTGWVADDVMPIPTADLRDSVAWLKNWECG